MPRAPLPPDEPARIAALRRAKILDTEPERAFDDLVRLASHVCGKPIALVSLVDADRQWFKAKVGITAPETPRDWAFCAHAILDSEVLIVEDATADERFADNPLVLDEPNIRFYAGAPLCSPDGHRLGTLCVIDSKPGTIDADQTAALTILADLARDQLAMRENLDELSELVAQVNTLQEMIPLCAWCKKARDDEGYWSSVEQYLVGQSGVQVSHGICPECAAQTRADMKRE